MRNIKKLTSIAVMIVLFLSYLPQSFLQSHAAFAQSEGSSLSLTREDAKKYEGLISAERGRTTVVVENGTVITTSASREMADWRDIVSIASGTEHTVGLKKDGTAVVEGVSEEDRNSISKWSSLTAVAAGENHTVGLKDDGTVVAAGNNEYGQLDANWNNIVAIAAGGRHTVGVKADGTVVAAGNNRSNQIDVGAWKDIVSVAAGFAHTVGLKKDGTVVAVGANTYGQLYVSGWRDIVAIAAGESYTLGLKSDGTVVATDMMGYPHLRVGSWTNIVAIAGGVSHTVGLRADGTMVAVGGNNWNGEMNVEGWQDLVDVQSYGQAVMGLKADGTVVGHGFNNNGKLDIEGWRDIVAIGVGDLHSVGLKNDGTVVAAGNAPFASRQNDVDDWKDIIAIAAGSNHTVGLKKDGSVLAVGQNNYGETNVSEWRDIVAIAAASYITVGLKADGTVVATGYDGGSGIMDLAGWQDITAISVSNLHVVGLKADGTLVTAGANHRGERNVSSWKGIVAINAGGGNTVGIKADGTVVGTGEFYGGINRVEDWRDIVAVSGKDGATVGLKKDGTVVAIGQNFAGELNVTPLKHTLGGIISSVDVLKAVAKPGEPVIITVTFTKKIKPGVKLALRGAVTTSPAAMEEVPGTNGSVYQYTFNVPEESNGDIHFQFSDVMDESGFIYKNVNANHSLTVDGSAPGLYGVQDLSIPYGASFDPMSGVAAYDRVDGRITSKVVVTGSVNTSKIGTYPLVYKVSDHSGNTAAVERRITVVDTEAPVFTGIDDLEIHVGDPFDPRAGVTAKDHADGDVTGSITITGSVDTSKPGTYQLIYSVKDQSGNLATKARKVTVVEVGPPKLEKLIGSTRYETAVEISKAGWSTSDTVFLVNGWAIADGLTTTPLAAAKNAPILLTTADTLPLETLAEIQRLEAKNIVLIGGSSVISENVKHDLVSKGYLVSRLGGGTRYETSLLIAQELDKLVDVHTVYVAYGLGEPDALSIAAQSGSVKQPIILAAKNAIPANTFQWLTTEDLDTAYFIGGTSVLDEAIINDMNKITKQNVLNNRIYGANRQETNAKVIQAFYKQRELPAMMAAHSNTDKLVDALAAGPLAAKYNVPVLLVSNYLDSMQISVIEPMKSRSVTQIGGGIDHSIMDQIVRLMN